MDKKAYIISMIGIANAERNVLRNIFKLSQYRTYSYTVASHGEAWDILLVDADDSQAMAEWQQSGTNDTSILTILVTKEATQDNRFHYIRRPFVATRVINALDQLVQKELLTARERIIGESDVPKSTVEKTTVEVATPLTNESKEKESSADVGVVALVVDDSAPVRKQIELELSHFGIKVDLAATGEQAIDFINEREYDLIFLDVVLPGIDGYQLCKSLKRGKTKKKTPVIMLTSKSSPFDRVKGALAGCDTYLTKPVKQETFQKVVKKYLPS